MQIRVRNAAPVTPVGIDPAIELVGLVAKEADAIGIPSAIIGAMALAHHGYVRATDDVDLGVCTAVVPKLRELQDRLRRLGLLVVLREPDDEDPLNGLLQVRRGVQDNPVEVVNLRGRLARLAIDRAHAEGELRFVRLPELVALKFHAGGRKSAHDIAELLSTNPDADLDELRAVCREFGFSTELKTMLSELDIGELVAPEIAPSGPQDYLDEVVGACKDAPLDVPEELELDDVDL